MVSVTKVDPTLFITFYTIEHSALITYVTSQRKDFLYGYIMRSHSQHWLVSYLL